MSEFVDSWYRLDLGDPMLASEMLDSIEADFLTWSKSAPQGKAAVFYRHESEGRLHCVLVLYFSPPAGEFALSLNALACPSPSPSDLALLAESQNDN